jgi:cytochrome c oxidase cbb3-type subunit 2
MRELFHRKIERNSVFFVLAIIAAASVGGIVEIAPLFTIDETVENVPDMRVYTPLELAGRNVYVREGCYACHSQMIRTLSDEVDRYGPFSLAVESQYDRPMLWGSKRTGPDLARIGGKYSDVWHAAHLNNPRDVVPESNMPAYPWLARTQLDVSLLRSHLAAQQALGVPYTEDMIAVAGRDAHGQATPESDGAYEMVERYGEDTQVSAFDGVATSVTELDALIAYLQVLGQLTDAAYQNTAAPELPADPASAGAAVDGVAE